MAGFGIGSEVRATDGLVGKLKYVIFDRSTGQPTDIVVELPDGNGSLVLPMRLLSGWDEKTVRLTAPLASLQQERLYVEEDFQACQPPATADIGDGASLSWQCRYGAGVTSVPAIAAYAPGAVAEDEEAALGRGTQVYSWEGPVGTLDHVLVDGTTGRITHLVIKRGPFLARSIVVPSEQVDAVGRVGVRLKGTRTDLSNMGAYSARPDEGIRAEVRECLIKVGCDLDVVDYQVAGGVVSLRGAVKDVATKREAERAVREIEGVVDVENALTPDTAVAAEITAALATDPRTELAEIGVTSMHGVITLEGVAGSEAEKEAAEHIARETAGVMLVVNEVIVSEKALGRKQPVGVFVIHPAQWFLLRGWNGGGAGVP